MAKRTIKVPLPKHHPDKFIQLMKDVVAQHESQGASSPLNAPGFVDMADFKAKLEQADALRKESIEHRTLAEAKMNEARVLLGTEPGQNITQVGTLYFMLNKIKKVLLAKHWDVPEDLAVYGFKVSVGTARFIGRPKKKKE